MVSRRRVMALAPLYVLRQIWQDARQVARRVACAVLRHKPLKIIDKSTLTSVSFVTGGLGTMVHVDASHVVCSRCGARRHEGAWVR
jgi:hypothetical protein